MKKVVIGIDLGSSNTTIYSSVNDEIVFYEPSVIALSKSTRQVKEIGYLANRIKDKSPYNNQVISPVSNGYIADLDACNLFLTHALESVNLGRNYRGATYIFSNPSLSTPVNTNALINLGKSLSAKEIYVESQAKLAALGASETVFSPSATLICDLGSGFTDIALLSMGEIVHAANTFISSSSLDEAIRRYLLQKQHLAIGLKTAEYIKQRLGNVSALSENQLVEVKGRDTITSLPSSIVVSSYELKNVIKPLLDFIILKITDVISMCQPELVSDITRNGLLLSGGGALLAGIKEYFQAQLSIPVQVIERPTESVGRGLKVFAHMLEKK